jgi:tetratricopeptide (TPR) repeat protein
VTTVSQAHTSSLPPIWNISFPRNPHFTGREELFAQLRAAFDAGEVAALTQPQAIHGLGGVGKTQLAVEYAYRYAREYDLVWFVRSESSSVLASDLAQLAMALQLPERDERDQNIVVQAVRRELSQRNRWLVIFDNAEEPNDWSPFHLPQTGHVLITSRNPNWSARAHPLDVQVLPRAQAVEFLLRRTNTSFPSFPSVPLQTETREMREIKESAEQLADALGCLPLALEQAGAYIEANGKTIAEYLKMYRAHERDLLAHKPATDYPQSVATTWQISFDAIAQQSAASVALLNLLAFFAPDAIPRELLQTEEVCETLRVSWDDEFEFDKAVQPLRRYSLVRVGNGLFDVHRLVQTMVRDQMDNAARKTFAQAALKCIDDAFPFDSDDVRTWTDCARLLEHARATTGETERLNIAPNETARLMNQVGLYLQDLAELAEAKTLFERALKIDEATFGKDHPAVAIRVNNLGGVLRDLGDLPRAKECYEHVIKIFEDNLGANHSNVATAVNNLGEVLRNLGDLPRAKECFERALTIWEANLGANHPQVAIAVNNLGLVLRDLGDLPRAKECFERALAIWETNLGANHPQVAIAVNNLGLVLRDLGDLPRAKECFERALAIWETNLGANHPNVATTVNNLGLVLQDLGDLPRAKECFERALAIDEATFGKDHPKIATRVNNLGSVLHDLGDLPRAKECYERALAIGESTFGKDHPNVATDVNNLGSVLQDLGDLPRAKECYERVTKIFEDNLGANHPNVATAINNLGSVLHDLGDLPRAKECYERALKILTQFLPADHPNIKIVRGNLEGVKQRMKDEG